MAGLRAVPCRMARLRLNANSPCGQGMRQLVFDAPRSFRSGYRVPGQFLEFELGGERSFFALASAPADPNVDLLVKVQSGTAALLCELDIGAQVDVGTARGKGFDLADIDGRPLHLFSMGSGIAPLRALLRATLKGLYRPTEIHLWQGSFSSSHLPYPDEFPQWERAGVRVHYCFDQATDLPGTVPDRLGDSSVDISDALCVWVGSPEFGQSVAIAAQEKGAQSDRIITNF